MSIQYKPELVKKIQSVLTENNTAKEVFDKINNKYPELIEYKTEQQGLSEVAKKQLLKEIASRLNKGEDYWCIINRNEKPIQYSLMNIDEDNDNNDDININDDIETIEEKLNIGYVYILDTHLQYNNQNVVKIGKANNIDIRMKQLNSEQSSYQKHTILYQFKVEMPIKIEKTIHTVLHKGRINPNKEGFYKDYVEARIDLIKSMIKEFEIE